MFAAKLRLHELIGVGGEMMWNGSMTKNSLIMLHDGNKAAIAKRRDKIRSSKALICEYFLLEEHRV